MTKNCNKPRIRFAGFADDWEQRKLNELGTTFTGLSGKSKNDFGHGNGLYIPYLNIFNNPLTDLNFLEKIEIDKNQNSVKYGDIFFTTSSETPEEVGMSSIWLGNIDNLYLNSFCFGYRLNDVNSINPLYLGYMFRAKDFRENVELLAQGISRYNISKNKVLEIKIKYPKSADEQNKIGHLFNSLDNLITLHQRKCEKLKNIKKSLLVKMFI